MSVSVDRALPVKLAALCVAMFGFGFLLVPLYNAFCAVTGLNGKTPNVAQQVVADPDPNRTVRVEFLSSVARGGRWEFEPGVSHLEVHPGELTVATFHARNLTGAARVAQAVPSIAPGAAAAHFRKTECFCFTTQPFAANESRELKVAFLVDRDLPAYIDTLSLSYTFYTVSE